MTQDQIKQAIEWVKEWRSSDEEDVLVTDLLERYSKAGDALLLRDAQLAVALEALKDIDAVLTMAPDPEGAVLCGVLPAIRTARAAAKKIKEMETR